MTILTVFAKKVAFVFNVPLLYSRYGTGNNLQLRLMQGIFSNANNICLFLMIFPRMSLHSKLVPVQYRKHEYACYRIYRLPVTMEMVITSREDMHSVGSSNVKISSSRSSVLQRTQYHPRRYLLCMWLQLNPQLRSRSK